MTFEEWMQGKFLGGMEMEFARDAWNAATKAEREACAKVCKTMYSGGNYHPLLRKAAADCEIAIQMRPNDQMQPRR